MTTSRVGRMPITVPKGVTVTLSPRLAEIKGPKGQVDQPLPPSVNVDLQAGILTVVAEGDSAQANALAGTVRALLNNHVHGVSEGFTIKLKLIGVGYRAQAGKAPNGCAKLDLTLGFSHPVEYIAPKGLIITTPSQTDIEVTGADKQVVGQAAANIRSYRPPEPYKGKGVRYADEQVILKETKKK